MKKSKKQKQLSEVKCGTFKVDIETRVAYPPEFFKSVASQVAKAYSILCERSKTKEGSDMTLLWRARKLLAAYDALIGYFHDDVMRTPLEWRFKSDGK